MKALILGIRPSKHSNYFFLNDPNESGPGIKILGIRSRDPFSGSMDMSVCMCIVHVLCTSSSSAMYHRILHIELHQCTKFSVASSKFPRTGGPLSNKVFSVLASAACTPQPQQPEKHTDWGSICVTCKFGTGDALRLACRSGKRTNGTKHLHVHVRTALQPIQLYGAK